MTFQVVNAFWIVRICQIRTLSANCHGGNSDMAHVSHSEVHITITAWLWQSDDQICVEQGKSTIRYGQSYNAYLTVYSQKWF